VAGHFLGVFLVAWLFSLALIVFFKLLTGQINTRGLLSDAQGNFAPERAQLMLATFASAFAYAQTAFAENEMVNPSTVVLSGFASSHVLYVASKFAREFLSRV
jgi:hypothetical protein